MDIKKYFWGLNSKALKDTEAIIGNIIKEKRQIAGLSQKDLAVKSGLCQPDISMIESGRSNITLETLAKLCKILDIKNVPL